MWLGLTLGPLLQGQIWVSKFKSAYTSLLALEIWRLGMSNQPKEIMCWESSDVVTFDVGPLLQGQTKVGKLKSAYICLIIVPRSMK